MTFAQKVKRVASFLFLVGHRSEAELVYAFTGGKRFVLLTVVSIFAFLPPKRDGLLDPIQIWLGIFLFFLLALALSNYIFAKIPATRRLIDYYLGEDFVSAHEINMLPRQAAKVVTVLGIGLAVKHGDDLLTAKVNAQTFAEYAETLKKTGNTMPTELARDILNRPSTTQQIVTTTLETAKEVGKSISAKIGTSN